MLIEREKILSPQIQPIEELESPPPTWEEIIMMIKPYIDITFPAKKHFIPNCTFYHGIFRYRELFFQKLEESLNPQINKEKLPEGVEFSITQQENRHSDSKVNTTMSTSTEIIFHWYTMRTAPAWIINSQGRGELSNQLPFIVPNEEASSQVLKGIQEWNKPIQTAILACCNDLKQKNTEVI